jgi:hypothetical protein
MPRDHVFCLCGFCGAHIPPWWPTTHPFYDVNEDDARFERWMDNACQQCGRRPRELSRHRAKQTDGTADDT